METKLQLAEEEYTMRMKKNNEITDPYMRFYCAVFNDGHDHTLALAFPYTGA